MFRQACMLQAVSTIKAEKRSSAAAASIATEIVVQYSLSHMFQVYGYERVCSGVCSGVDTKQKFIQHTLSLTCERWNSV